MRKSRICESTAWIEDEKTFADLREGVASVPVCSRIFIEGGGIRQDERDKVGHSGRDRWNKKNVGWQGLHRFLKCPQCMFTVMSIEGGEIYQA